MTGLSTRIQQNTDFGVQNTAERIEQPSVGVDLLAVLLLQTEHHLHWRQSAWPVVMGTNELLVGSNGKLGRVFKLIALSVNAIRRLT